MELKEIKEIHRYIKKYNIIECVQRVPVVKQAEFDLSCPFRSDVDKTCSIHKVKPTICRKFQCNLPTEELQRNKETLHNRYKIIDLREEFFRKE